ncbi:hypothetical protein FRC10_011203 [Ceratobasidium sp. 414]|nr:hypothetical protein FRC10_011203 [Ceratobasidium sp. 414]
MSDADRTPMKAWRNYVYTSQSLPSRANKQLPEEKREKQRLEEIEAKKQELKYHEPPAIGRYLDGCLTIRVASILFGAEAFMPSSDIMWDCFHKVTNSLIRRAWERQQRAAKAMLKRSKAKKEEYRLALQKAVDKPCPRLLRKASELLKQWKNLAEITGESGELSFMAEGKALEDLWDDLGYSHEPEGNNKSESTYPLSTAVFCLNMTEVLGDLQALDGSDSSAVETVTVDLLHGTGNCDLGVDEFAQTHLGELIHLLGIGSTVTLPMASGELKTKWHQLVGIATMLKHMFTTNVGDAPCPTLLCDDVGLRKTAQIIGTICMLCIALSFKMPGGICHLSSRQWYKQIKLFTVDSAFQIIIYSKEYYDPAKFFEVGGLWDKVAKGETAHQTIFIVPVSTIATEARTCLERPLKGAAGRDRAFRGDTAQIVFDTPSILNKKFLVFASDELHNFRNLNYSHLGAQHIAANSLVRIGATATPIFTGSKDLAALGRLLRHQTMIGQAGYELAMAMLKSEQTRRREIKRGVPDSSEENTSESTALALEGIESVKYDGSMSPTNRNKALHKFEAEENITVLLISSVGTTGLNLTMASVVIFLSGLWSGMEIKQTIGRLWRAGQIEIVIVHHIFTPGTADILLASLAGDKVLMLDHLYEAGSIAQKVFDTSKGGDYVETEARSAKETDDVPAGGVTKSKAPVRSRKHVAEAESSFSANETITGDALSPRAQLSQPPSGALNAQPEAKPSDEKAPAVGAMLLLPVTTATHETIVSPAPPGDRNCRAPVPCQTPLSAYTQSPATSRVPSPTHSISPVARTSSPVRGSSPVLPVESPVWSPPSSPPPAPPSRGQLVHVVEPNASSFVPTDSRATHSIEQPRKPSASYNTSTASTKSPMLSAAPIRPEASARVATASTAATIAPSDHADATRPASREVFFHRLTRYCAVLLFVQMCDHADEADELQRLAEPYIVA